MFRRRLLRIILITLCVLALEYFAGPRPSLNTSCAPIHLPKDLDMYLAQSERYPDIIPGTEKTIVWANKSKSKTPVAVALISTTLRCGIFIYIAADGPMLICGANGSVFWNNANNVYLKGGGIIFSRKKLYCDFLEARVYRSNNNPKSWNEWLVFWEYFIWWSYWNVDCRSNFRENVETSRYACIREFNCNKGITNGICSIL